ncbi:MAG: T9SS type A sorting domain-containing protein [Bacteroides sp.]|jgi:hypothetical protein|nr:T9SS type A sorting domain-containing protein [Bacteroides sp.]
MKRFFILLGLWLWGLSLWGQQVTRAEYFWDADPGFGNATPLALVAAEDLEVSLEIPLEALEPGLHTLFVRARDENGRWSQCFLQSVLVLKAAQIPSLLTRAEYFFDEDPGYGQGIPLDLPPGDQAVLSLALPLEILEDGIHTLFVRARDDKGSWGLVFSQTFLMQTFPQDQHYQLTAVEYFFDEDPGFGQGISIPFETGDEVQISMDLPLESLGDGIHTLFVRARDDKGSWGLVFSQTFLLQPFPQDQHYQLTAMEYFFDEDPGFGQGMPLDFEPAAAIALDLELPLEDLPEGIHTLYVRARDDKGSWGMVFQQNFLKFFTQDEEPLVNRMEYFINEDPGFGNGIPIPFNTPRETALKLFEVDAALLQPGTNTLYVRGLDTRGRWGLVYQTTFETLETPPCDPPTDLTATDVAETTATLGWTEQSVGTSWDLLWVPNGMDHTEDGIVAAGIETNPNTVENLFQTTLYDFYVRTACSDGQVSPWAGPASFHTLPLATNTLTLLSDPPGGGTVTGEGSYAYGETITITASPNTNFVFQYWTGDTNFLDDPQEPTATVTMPAQPIALTAHFQDVTGIGEAIGQGLRIFPNPARDQLQVEFIHQGKEAILQLMNIQGHIVDQLIINEPGRVNTSINTSTLPDGLYLIIVRNEQWRLIRKVVIKH